MLRYIDADKLTRMFIGNLTFVPQEFIDSAETVDAIPIEWLEKKYKDLEYSYSFGATDELKSRMDGIRYAINLWRKENEHKRSNNT